jgi:predicted ABC-type ATPase
MSQPVCTIIAGPNGAGKSTFAEMQARRIKGDFNFVNADLIAAGLSPFAPDRELMTASKLFLNEIHRYISRRESFTFETTLSGKTYAKLISKLRADGWRMELIYLWIPSVAVSLDRVRERAAHGGHNISPGAIIRRYPKSIYNLLYIYSDLCIATVCFDNSKEMPNLIFKQNLSERSVIDAVIYKQLVQAATETS